MRSIRHGRTVAIAILMAWYGFQVTGDAANGTNDNLYVTWPPVEPDKAIAAWLIIKYVAPDARFAFVERGTSISNGILFDVPGADYTRDHRRCTSEAVIHSYHIKDKKALDLANLARRAEIAFWADDFSAEENALINEIRDLSSATTNFIAGMKRAIELVDEWASAQQD